jgi:hypothetical protein
LNFLRDWLVGASMGRVLCLGGELLECGYLEWARSGWRRIITRVDEERVWVLIPMALVKSGLVVYSHTASDSVGDPDAEYFTLVCFVIICRFFRRIIGLLSS